MTATGKTITLQNPIAGATYIIEIFQDGGGSKTYTFSGGAQTLVWNGGSQPNASTGASKGDIYTFFYDGARYIGNMVAANV